jgi:hypothetical protein
MRYLIDLENEWPEYYDLEAEWKKKNESEDTASVTTQKE